jgi:hypothetical protein
MTTLNITQPQLDRYVLTQSSFTRPKDNVSDLRRAYIDLAKMIKPTHYLTFNFYRDCSMERAQKMMDLWNYQIHQRLFRSHPSKTPDDKALVMLGYPEYTGRGHIHYHCVARVNPERETWFDKIAAKRWKKIVPTGELHIQPMRETETDLEDATAYMTKSSTFAEWYIPKDYRGSAFDATAYAGHTKH